MTIKSKQYKGIYKDLAQIELSDAMNAHLELPNIPFGSEISIVIHYDVNEYLSGLDKIVWATHYLEQAETIKGALLAQKIKSSILKKKLKAGILFLLKVEHPSRVEQAINFIWRSKEGLQLKPDWCYPLSHKNESFSKWTR